MKEPLISIIVLCYNTGERIITTLNSIQVQTYKNWELIIVDDNSIDGSVNIIYSWLEKTNVKAKVIINDINKGIGKSLNIGICNCKGEYLTFIGDDEWVPYYLQDFCYALMSAPPTVAIITSKAQVVNKVTSDSIIDILDAKSNIKKLQYPQIDKLFFPIKQNLYICEQKYFFDVLFWANPVVAFCVMIRMTHLKEIGLFCEDYLMEDFPTWFKLALKYDMIYMDEIYGSYNRYSTNISSEKGQIINEQVLMIRNLYYDKILFHRTRLKICNEIIDNLTEGNNSWHKLFLIFTSWKLQKLYFRKILLRIGF